MKKCIWITLLALLVSCHRYDDPEPIPFGLPEELEVEATQVWVRLYDLVPSIKLEFEYNGRKYKLASRSANRIAENANSICHLSTEKVITTQIDEFISQIWSQESESFEGFYDWGNKFNDFDDYSLEYKTIEPINPGYRGRDNMLGVRKLRVSVRSSQATMIYSQTQFLGLSDESYAQIYSDNPAVMIDNVHVIFDYLSENYASTLIEIM
jgi:hypothetical protein